MFKKITLDNFRSFGHIEFNISGTGGIPKSCAIIYGENGSGKSNLISSFVFLKKTMDTLRTSKEMEPLKEKITVDSIDFAGSEEKGLGLQKIIYSFLSKQTNLQAITKQYRMIDSKNGIAVNFSFQIDGHDGQYELKFDDQNRLTYEKLTYLLNERAGTIYEIERGISKYNSKNTETDTTFSSVMFKDQSYKKKFMKLIEQYWGKHTLFSILNVQSDENNEKFMKDSLGNGILKAFDFFKNYSVIYEDFVHESHSNGFLTKLPFGAIPKGEEKQLRVFEEALNDFFTRIYSDVKKVYYKTEDVEGKIKYELFFKKLIYGQMRDVSIKQESTGTRKLLEIFPTFFECICGNTVLIDEMDTGIHDMLMDGVFREILSSIKGQLIATTHNTMLIEDTPPESVYIIRIDSSGYKNIECIKKIDITQTNHNNRNRYLAGAFEGVPISGPIDFSDIVSHALDSLEVKR